MATPPKRSDTTSSSSRPSSPSPARSTMRNRMTSAMRRASTGLAFGSKLPTLSRSSSKNSLKVDPAQAPTASETHVAPSPVVETAEESPSNQVHLGPSPLHNSTAASEPAVEADPVLEPTPVSAPVPQAEAAPIVVSAPQEETTAEQITRSPEQLASELPHAAPASAPEPQPFGFSDPILPVTQPPAAVESPVLATADVPTEAASAPLPEPTPVAPLTPPAEPVRPAIMEDHRSDYFSYGDPIAPTVAEPEVEEPRAPEPAVAAPSVLQPFPVEEPARYQTTSHVQIPSDDSTFAWSDEPALGRKRSSSSLSEVPQHAVELSQQSGLQSGKASTRESKSSLASSYGNVVPNTTIGERRGRSSIVRFVDPAEDPFADPPESAKKSLSPIESVNMPEPVTEPQPILHVAQQIQDSPSPISFPLPPMQDVIIAQSSRQPAPSAYSLGERDGASLAESAQQDMDERMPLLAHVGGKSASRAKTNDAMAIPFTSGPVTGELTTANTIRTLGWTEYVLPDSSYYYHHEAKRVTTDIDLRNSKKLQVVTEYLEKKLPTELTMPPPQGWELWLKDVGVMRHEVVPVKSWVNHKLRIITLQPPPMVTGEGLVLERFSEDDKLDLEYRYWGFMEGHPAHSPLPAETHTEAMDALKWSYTDCLLPSARPAPPPFAPQECQELMSLLRSFDSNATPNTAVVQTRIVSRVLLRVAQWRQIYYRPDKPLPRDAIKGTVETRIPFRRAFLDFFIGCLCLGIPYIFMTRTRHHNFDEESGLHTAGPMLMLTASACLVAAVIMSASVTFLSLPSLDDVARLTGFLAILFSASSMVSSVLALFRYKTDIDRSVVYIGSEGLTHLSRSRVIMSLPLVFLAWAIAAFMTGITFYSFRGATVTSRMDVKHPFEAYTHWAVVATLGALGGMLFVAALLSRR
ncbi:hypothetical protein VTO73DRAFT_9377 [Trametes versicolor]